MVTVPKVEVSLPRWNRKPTRADALDRVYRILAKKYNAGDKLGKRQFYAFLYGASIRTLHRMALEYKANAKTKVP